MWHILAFILQQSVFEKERKKERKKKKLANPLKVDDCVRPKSVESNYAIPLNEREYHIIGNPIANLKGLFVSRSKSKHNETTREN